MRVKMSKPPPSAPTASAIGPCPTVIKIVGRPGKALVLYFIKSVMYCEACCKISTLWIHF